MKREPEKIEEQHFDLMVIGGGVTGAAIAYEAASRGLSVALFEKNDFGGATSAATSKMIHGGLRYLANMELKLVRESLRERKIFCNIAPNFVHPFPYLLASYKTDKTPGWMLKIAMIIYDLLSFDKNWLRDKSKSMPLHKSISKEKIAKNESQILRNGLQNSQIYYDCLNFSPERLTLAFVKSAVKYGAKVLNYAEVKSLLFKEKKQISGAKIYDGISRKEFQVNGNYVINSTGPWVDLFMQKVLRNKVEKTLKRSERIHIITTKKVEKYVVTLTTKLGRHCFVVPWRNYTLLGTTDKEFVGHPDEYRVTKESVLEFINEVNEVFGEKNKFSFSDIKYVYPKAFKHPNARLFEEPKATFQLSEKDFFQMESTGDGLIDIEKPTLLTANQIQKFKEIVGSKNVSENAFERVKFSSGQTLEEHLKLRRKMIEQISDLVVHPRNKAEIVQIVQFCNSEKIPVYTYGGGSSVNFGVYPQKGGITLVLSTHLNKVLEVNEMNQTVRVQTGILGPQLENDLNHAIQKYHTLHNFTCGHFPQSFEFSTIGGWIVTLGSGQQSSYYGDAADLVLAVEMVTPVGTIKTLDFPATATGSKILDIIKGSEGIFGIVTEVSWKMFKYMPENRKYFGFISKNWESAVKASREISQGEFGMPAVFRISDAEETHHGLKLYGIEGSIFDKLMKFRGFQPNKRCLFIGTADGAKSFTQNIKKQVKKIAHKNGGMYLTAFPAKKWEPGRYRDPYLKEDLMDFGILIDTLETSVKWDNLHQIHKQVRNFIKSRPQTICLSHASHFYPQGTNLYFIFILKENDLRAYQKFQKQIIQVMEESGGSLSHHHGVGKMASVFLEKHLGKNQVDVLRALKNYFDPENIMNPGNLLES